ncbi:GNAT family N-acetyltransferase [Amycolatopsis sp. NPDC047767]|uniref:GNAT family N-acetyltransferase n=1 Tax=Amycolatopsis sp. NPDC047767 TaxID=3156765 RepID=UPI0034560F54
MQARYTGRLRLEAVGPELADDLFRLHQDPGIARWYGAWTAEDALRTATEMGRSWHSDGAHKWLAYDRADGVLIGRGGLSRTRDGQWELGWAVRESLWGRGYATEIGRAGLEFAWGRAGRVTGHLVHRSPQRTVASRHGAARVPVRP